MDKLWYILNDRDQFGPFDETDLQNMFRNGKIDKETTLMRRGFRHPVQVKDLIKKPQVVETKSKNSPRVIKESFKKSSVPPAPPQQEAPAQTPSIKTTSSSKKPFIIISSFAIFTILAYSGMRTFVLKQSFNLERPKNVRAKTFSQHKKAFKKAYERNNHKWGFVLSKDLKNIYLMSSLPGTQKVKITFKGTPNKILSTQPVEFQSEVALTNNISEIKEFNFIKGTQIIPGAYQIELELVKSEMNTLQKFFLKDFKIKETFKEKMVLKFHSKKTYSRELAKFQKLQKRKNNAFVQDIKMKYETLLTIANRITDNLNQAKKGPLSKDQVEFRKNYFLQDYQMKYGTFFSNFVIENEKKFKDLTNSTDELKTGIIAHYSTLSSIARSLGMVSIDAIDSFTGLSKDREIFSPILKRYESIITTCKKKIDKLENIDLKQ